MSASAMVVAALCGAAPAVADDSTTPSPSDPTTSAIGTTDGLSAPPPQVVADTSAIGPPPDFRTRCRGSVHFSNVAVPQLENAGRVRRFEIVPSVRFELTL